MAVLFAWNERPKEKISLENLRLATELPDAELRRTLWVPELTLNSPFFFCSSPINILWFFLVIGGFSQIEETAVNVPSRSPISKRFRREHSLCRESGFQSHVCPSIPHFEKSYSTNELLSFCGFTVKMAKSKREAKSIWLDVFSYQLRRVKKKKTKESSNFVSYALRYIQIALTFFSKFTRTISLNRFVYYRKPSWKYSKWGRRSVTPSYKPNWSKSWRICSSPLRKWSRNKSNG